MMSDYPDRLERELIDKGRRAFGRPRMSRRTNFVLFSSAAVTAAVVAAVFVIGQTGGGRARPAVPGSGKASAVSTCGARHPAFGRPTALVQQLSVLRHPDAGRGHRSFIPPSWHALRNDVRYDKLVMLPGRLGVEFVPVLLCSLPNGVLDRGNPRSIAQEHILVQVLGPEKPFPGAHRWVDGGNLRQIIGGDAFSGFYLPDHHWLQLVLTADDVARVKLSLAPAGGPVTSRTVTPIDNVVAAVVGVDNGPSIITSYDAHGRVLHREYVPNHDCLTHHTAQACVAPRN